jgi:hypothetical protein
MDPAHDGIFRILWKNYFATMGRFGNNPQDFDSNPMFDTGKNCDTIFMNSRR